MTGRRKQPCIVLAGGLGTRLRSAVADRPKCLAPVGGRTFIEIEIDTLLAAGVDDIILSLGHQAELVVQAVAATMAARPVRWVTEPRPLGTGGAIAHAMDALGLTEALVANGDTHLSGGLGAMLVPLRRDENELFRMAVVRVAERSRFGGVHITTEGRVDGFVDKGHDGPGQINAGLYRLCRQALPANGDEAYSLEDAVLPALVARAAVTAAEITGSFIDIGVPEDYFRFCAERADV